MIDIQTVRSGKKGRLFICDNGASDAAKQALRSLLTSRPAPTLGGVTIGVEDIPSLGNTLEQLKAVDRDDATTTPEAKQEIDQWFAYRDNLLQLKHQPADETLLQQIKGWKTQPYPDQIQCIKFHIARGRSLEAGETGIGKSMILLYTYLYWKTIGKARRAIILCLNSGKLDWETQIREHTTLKPFVVGNGSLEVLGDLQRFERSGADVLVIHYDALLTNSKSTADVFAYMKTMRFDFVAVDEVHILKNPMTIRHRRIIDLLSGWGDVKLVCATGTAVDGNPKSAWAPIKLVEERRGHYFPSFWEFRKHFVVLQDKYIGYGRKIKVEVGVKNLPRLRDMLAYTSIRFLKAEVLNRPSKIYQTRLVTLKGMQLKLYNQMKNAARGEIEQQNVLNLSLATLQNVTLRLRQIINHPSLVPGMPPNVDSAKYEELDLVVEEILSNPNAQLLVWTQWRAGVEMLVQRYKKHGAIAFYGGSDDREVRDAVLSKKARVVIAIPEKAGTSVDFLKVCRTAVYLEKPWHLSLYRQSLDRIDRRANTDPALIISIDAIGSIDQVVNAVLKRRQDVFDAVTLSDDQVVALGKEELLKYLR